MTEPIETVWIVGSGFSQALGGPLLDGLLSESAHEDTRQVFSSLPDREVVYKIYESLKNKRWKHAEQFLEFADLACEESSPYHAILKRRIHVERLDGWKTLTPERFYDLAALSIAAEVSMYTDNVDLRSEAWAPYVEWASDRQGNDSIITFNYDTVVEQLGKDNEVTRLGQETVMLPFADEDVAEDLCPIYKLHGSANWAFDEKHPRQEFKIYDRVSDFTLDNNMRPLIATPGATKKHLCTTHLEVIWQKAMTKVREAGTIVFLGYRFPPSDSFARTELLRAIRKNESPHVRVLTVLGPDVGSADSKRLQSLLGAVLEVNRFKFNEGNDPRDETPTYAIEPQPLYVEDFLSVLNHRLLHGWG